MLARLDTRACPTPVWLPDAHSQTLYGALVARVPRITFVRQRIETPDGDFIDWDVSAPGIVPQRPAGPVSVGSATASNPPPLPANRAACRWMDDEDWRALTLGIAHHSTHAPSDSPPALLLLHGLEGASHSRYAQAIGQYFRARGWIVVVAHFRGCSGVPNRLARAYHSGDSDELGFILSTARSRLPQARWHAVGVSLGGNALLKYLGEQGESATWLTAAAAVSAPLDLVAAGVSLSHGLNRQLYARHFLRSMKAKILEKARRFPGAIDVVRLAHVRSLRDFDDAYTAPMHGFAHALDYWQRSSSKPWLPAIRVPTLVLNARNDPFLPEAALPGPDDCAPALLLHQPATGGHASFVTGRFPGNLSWLPQRLAQFFVCGQ